MGEQQSGTRGKVVLLRRTRARARPRVAVCLAHLKTGPVERKVIHDDLDHPRTRLDRARERRVELRARCGDDVGGVGCDALDNARRHPRHRHGRRGYATRALRQRPLSQAIRPLGGAQSSLVTARDTNDVPRGAVVALGACRADVRKAAERLPHLAIPTGLADLVLQDEGGVAQDVEVLRRLGGSTRRRRQVRSGRGAVQESSL
jgi:hypothetical protein